MITQTPVAMETRSRDWRQACIDHNKEVDQEPGAREKKSCSSPCWCLSAFHSKSSSFFSFKKKNKKEQEKEKIGEQHEARGAEEQRAEMNLG